MSTNLLPEATALWQPKANPWIIGVVVSLAAFMEVLDTSIANVALRHIAGNLGASYDESTWVLTSYLAANAVVLPIAGFMVSWLGRKRFFLICIAAFTVCSLLCGMAPTLGALLLFRVLQGAFGGGLQPMTQAILADSFPESRRGLAFALYGVTAVCAPAIGPTLGGWITDNYTWRWIFYINVPFGALTSALVYYLVEDPPYLARARKAVLRNMDYVGFALLIIGVAALQVMLDKGQEDDWFGSRFITTLAITAVVGLVSMVIWEWHHKDPIVDVRLFKNSNFAMSNLMFFMLGLIMFAAFVLLPQFLQTLMGYTAQTAGLVLSVGALVVAVTLPCIGHLTQRFQARYLLAVGWILLVIGMYVSSRRTDLLVSFNAATQTCLWEFVPMGFLFVGLNTAAYVGLPTERSNAGSGIMNFTRNIGSSVGTSFVTTVIARRSQYHQSVLAEHTRSGHFGMAFQALTSRLSSAGLSVHEAQHQAVGRLYVFVQLQAQTLSYMDAYWMLAGASVLMFLLSFLLAKNDPSTGGEVHMH
jgi:DHA2 family multidrug resistance protein